MQFFANLFHFDSNGFVIPNINSPEWIYAPDQPRSTFDTFTFAFLTVFQIVTIDNWSIVMFNCGRAVGTFGIVHPTLVFLFGTFFVTNLFLAMLVNNFLDSDVLKVHDVEAVEDGKAKTVADTAGVIGAQETPTVAQVSIPVVDSFDEKDESEISNMHNASAEFEAFSKDASLILCVRALWHNFLTACSRVLNHDGFEVGITVLVCVSCVSLAMDNPLNDPNSILVNRLFYIDLGITVIFTLEMLLKILVFGAFRKRTHAAEAYFRNGRQKSAIQ